MTIFDQQLGAVQGDLADMQILSACFSGCGVDVPHELRLHFSDHGQSEGVVTARSGTGSQVFSADLGQLASAVPCFTSATEIVTGSGLVPVADLRVGQRVITRDNGPRDILWIGRRRFDWRALALNPLLRPVRISAGALGQGMPERDMVVSPNHRFLIVDTDGERLLSAVDLLGRPGIVAEAATSIDYVQVLLDRHELLLGDGCWSESFQPTPAALAAMPETHRAELFATIDARPEAGLDAAYPAVRELGQIAAA